MVDKTHDKLLTDIRRYIEQLGVANLGESDFFKESSYKTSQNKILPCYQITKRAVN